MSCVAVVGVSYFGIAFQQQISATTFLAAYAAVRATLLLGNVDPTALTTELSAAGATGLAGLFVRPIGRGGPGQTLEGSFSAVSKPNFAKTKISWFSFKKL